MAGEAINIRSLSVSYGGTPALRGVSCGPDVLNPGRLVALIGPNGSGKSTLLRTLCGLLPYEGSVTLGGRELRSHRRAELARLVGILPQRAGTDASYSVYDIIGLGRIPHGGLLTAGYSDSDDRAILDAACRMRVEPLLFRRASRLSGGEAQRVFMAMLLAQNPAVFLLDEPSSASDIKHAALSFSVMRDLAASGRLVISAVHDVNLAVRFADLAVVMKDGNILCAVPAGELDEKLLSDLYETPFELFTSRGGGRAWHARVN